MQCVGKAAGHTQPGEERGARSWCKAVPWECLALMQAQMPHTATPKPHLHMEAPLKLADWDLEAVVRSGAALQKLCRQPRSGHLQGHLALGACPGQQMVVGEGLAGPAWSIDEE